MEPVVGLIRSVSAGFGATGGAALVYTLSAILLLAAVSCFILVISALLAALILGTTLTFWQGAAMVSPGSLLCWRSIRMAEIKNKRFSKVNHWQTTIRRRRRPLKSDIRHVPSGAARITFIRIFQ